MGLGSGFPVGAWAGLAPRPVFLRPYTSHYRNRESLVRRQAAERHLEDGGIYSKRWWARLYPATVNSAHIWLRPTPRYLNL